MRAALSGGGQRRVPFAPATGAARSGPALTPLRCQRPAGKRQDVIDVERPKARSVQLAHSLPRPRVILRSGRASERNSVEPYLSVSYTTCYIYEQRPLAPPQAAHGDTATEHDQHKQTAAGFSLPP